jgi:hypothetical protein
MLCALREESESAVAGAALPQAREQPQGEGPGPAGRERLSEEDGSEGEVGDDAGGGESRGGRQRGRAEDGRGTDDGAQGSLGPSKIFPSFPPFFSIFFGLGFRVRV